jgi:hypothetical protein
MAARNSAAATSIAIRETYRTHLSGSSATTRRPLVRSLSEANDGPVAIFIQKESAGQDKDGNCLPAPNARFFAVLRVYGPGEAGQTGKRTAPAVASSVKSSSNDDRNPIQV